MNLTDKSFPGKGAAAIQPPFFKTEFYTPHYRDGRWGDWEVRTAPIVHDHGYYTDVWLVRNMKILLKHDRETPSQSGTWMAICPHEVESQELACRYATGHTAVMGLGMGWVAINAALNPAVEKVTVVEKDPGIIEFFFSSAVLETAPETAQKKIRIIEADALEWQPLPHDPVDFIHADIWKNLAAPQTLDQVRQMQANIRAREIYIWGQELIIHNLAARHWPDLEAIDTHTIKRCVKELIGLPLLIPKDLDYGDMIAKVIQNRLKRKLPLEKK